MPEKRTDEFIRNCPFGYVCHTQAYGESGYYIAKDMNAAFERIIGLPADRLLGVPLGRMPADQAFLHTWTALYEKVKATGQKQEDVVRFGKEGRWYKITAYSPDGVRFISLLGDVSAEMERAESLARQNEEQRARLYDLELIFNSTRDAIFLVACEDGEFRFVRNNWTHRQLTGFETMQIVGKTPVELMGEDIGRRWEEKYRQCVAGGQSLVFEETLEFAGQQDDWIISLTPVVTQNASLIIGSRTNISALKILQREKEELLTRLQSMVEGHSAVMLIIDPETGKIESANPAACRFYGYTSEEILRLNIQDINTLSEAEIKKRRMEAYRQEKLYFLFPHRLKNGEIRLVDVYSCPIVYGGKTQLFSIIFDVTDREKLRGDLFLEKRLLGITLNSIGDGVVTTDVQGRITALNQAAQTITGWSAEEAKGMAFTDVFRLRSEETGQTVENPVEKVLRSGMVIGLANHTVLINKSGRAIPIADSAAPIIDEQGSCYGVVMVFRDVSREKEQQEQILYLSYRDPLTGLYNRRYVDKEMKKLSVALQLPLAVIMGDVNGLKVTNDVFGHETGDRLLQRVAAIFKTHARKDDIVARWGGDEFLLLLPKTDETGAEELIRKLKDSFLQNRIGTLQISVSLGLSVKRRLSDDMRHVMQKAEEQMYHQKLLEGMSYRNNIINTLLATLYEKSLETEEHAKRLEVFCHAIGEELNLSGEELNELSLLAMLHDIGKVGIHQSILQKPGPLTQSEWEEMRHHPEIGYRIVQNTPELSIVAEYILSHHERWDGSGYPRGLSGYSIPLLCRILAIADSFDAMTNDRIYRQAVGTEEALREIKASAGTQFDPELVRIFIKVMHSNKLL